MRRLLLLYPRAWRERYGTEMEAVLDGLPFDPRAALDLVVCAVDAHLHPRHDRQPLPLAVQAALLIGAGTLVIPFVIRSIELTVLRIPHVFILDLALPAAVVALAALVSWRAGWRLAAWFCGLLAVQRAVVDSAVSLWALLGVGAGALEPLRLASAAWHPAWFRLAWLFVAALFVLVGVLAALLLRRMDVGWPIGLGIGLALIAVYTVPALRVLPFGLGGIWTGHPSWIRLAWLVSPAQTVAWAALTAALLRRARLTWPASLLTGTILWLLLGSPWFLLTYVSQLTPATLPLTLEPGVVWAAAVAALVSMQRGVAPAAQP